MKGLIWRNTGFIKTVSTICRCVACMRATHRQKRRQVIKKFINQLIVFRRRGSVWRVWKASVSKDRGVTVSAVLPVGQ
ncbi:MAG: hypothetical protein HY607_04400 [Planctomycetes bacterium]|uniref:hypothetical protein n=1 Tax=Candidatus Wunengus californicus TaxID=3367619 RepID=UPI00402938EF|nr:hypothetical protein [Planctomycetota bacterium]MBI4221907.1 hypothetical protein [Planctomycetota bacterium]